GAGWRTGNKQGWRGPLYWDNGDGGWSNSTLTGFRPVDEKNPVTHVSYSRQTRSPTGPVHGCRRSLSGNASHKGRTSKGTSSDRSGFTRRPFQLTRKLMAMEPTPLQPARLEPACPPVGRRPATLPA